MKLAGIRVLDMSSFIPGPYLTLAMADHGAEVIKIEAPGGDPGREFLPLDERGSIFFRGMNRGKKSMVFNLKDPADREAFLKLAETADIIVESNRPGVAARLGVDYDSICARNPRIIYCSISAFGQDGPYVHRPAHDLTLEAYAGIIGVNRSGDGGLAIPALPNADLLSGLQGLAGVLMALYARERSGVGDYIDISMHEALVGGLLNIVGTTIENDREPDLRYERSLGGSAFYRIYATGDGDHIVLGGQEIKFARELLTALGRPDLVALCQQGPGPHQRPVMVLLEERFAAMTLAQASELLGSLDVCWAPVNSLPQALADPQLEARGFILRDAAGSRQIGPPIRFAREPAAPMLEAPALNAHGHLKS